MNGRDSESSGCAMPRRRDLPAQTLPRVCERQPRDVACAVPTPGRGLLFRLVCALALLGAALPASGQPFSQRGLVEGTGIVYFQPTPVDDRQLIGEALFRQEASWTPVAWLSLAGAFDARAATDDRVDPDWRFDCADRGLKRPAACVRRLSASFRRGGLTFEAGKQFVRWGKVDILNPTDRFAPRDLLDVIDNDFLAVSAARLTYERGSDTIDLVWSPRFTPSRLPLSDGRWATSTPEALAASLTAGSAPGPPALPFVDLGVTYPSRSQAGVRWNHVASGFEYSLSIYDGFDHLPRIDASVNQTLGRIEVSRIYPVMRMVGGDMVWPLRWFTIKAEAGYFWTTDDRTDDYGSYVIQLERQSGEWLFVGGYSGEFVTERRAVREAPLGSFERGMTKSFLGRGLYTIDVNRSLTFEGVVRQDGRGYYGKAAYSQSLARHWRATARVDLLGGSTGDFLGQYRRNSSVRLVVRYSY
jgi:hypothetical protein